jgi:hypothetical protein
MRLIYGNKKQFLVYIGVAFICFTLWLISHLGIILDNIYIAIFGLGSSYMIILCFLVKEKFFS